MFMNFDRVIVMAEGHTFYTGPPQYVFDYFFKFGLTVNLHSNPADKLSMIAAEPRRYLN